MDPNESADLDTDVDTGAGTDTDTDTSKETNVGVEGVTAIRISLSSKENRTGCDKKRLKSQVQCCTCVQSMSNCRGVRVAREPVCATREAAVPHVLKKTSTSIERYHGSSCSCAHTGDGVCKESLELATQNRRPPSFLSNRPTTRQAIAERWHVNCLCVPVACDERVFRVTLHM